jgi:pyridoxal phosphate enzyme (YggS family)
MRLTEVRGRIAEAAARAGRDVGRVRLVAVAKTATPETLRAAWEAGQRAYGHNRVERLEEHRAVLPDAEWHAIGPLQGKKVRRAVRAAACIHTVGEEKTAERIRRVVEEDGLEEQAVLLQANLLPEDGRYGCPLPAEGDTGAAPGGALRALAEAVALQPGLHVRGLMTIAPPDWDAAALRTGFARLRAAAEALSLASLLPDAPELSMGMSGDYEIAVEEGATLVRVGRAVFPSEEPRATV